MSQQTSEAVIKKSVVVRRPVEEAFELFTTDIATWGPVKTHSVAEENAETVILEPQEGGRFYERTRDGDEHLWGTVTVWEPPSKLACTWHPGRDEETGQEIEVVFEAHDDGTRIVLTHTGWEKRGSEMAEAMANYDQGWDRVLGFYTEAAKS
jgi:uncharacterized protein YndB with AHSA1/START domain